MEEEASPGADGAASRADQNPCGEDGVDVTLIRWMLSKTPEERLQALQEAVSSLLSLRGDEPED